jgi:predicted site-specific integrase-resolvase
MLWHEAMAVLGVSYSTLRRYVKKGVIRTSIYQMPRRVGNCNYWDEDVYSLVGRQLSRKAGTRSVAAYFRVNPKGSEVEVKKNASGYGERGDAILKKKETMKAAERVMQEQKARVYSFASARGLKIETVYEEMARAVEVDPDKRPAFHQLVQDIMLGNVGVLLLDTKCRLSRFAYDEISMMMRYYDVEIIVLNEVIDDLFYQEEQADDLAYQIEKLKLSRLAVSKPSK